jgi:hypothetical protein
MVTLAWLFRPSTAPLEIQFLSLEAVENQLLMLAERAGDLLHGLDAGTHSLAARLVEKLAGPGGRARLPVSINCGPSIGGIERILRRSSERQPVDHAVATVSVNATLDLWGVIG